MSVIGIYLAAGKSSRFGSNKLACAIKKDLSLGSLALKTALQSELDKVVIVTKKSDSLTWIPTSFYKDYNNKMITVLCEMSNEGLSQSIICGLTFIEENFNAEAVVIMLADQPLVSKAVINNMITTYKENKKEARIASFVGSMYNGIIYPPTLFTKRIFKHLYTLKGDVGARYLIRNNKSEGITLTYQNPMLFFDVDTKVDYYALLNKVEK